MPDFEQERIERARKLIADALAPAARDLERDGPGEEPLATVIASAIRLFHHASEQGETWRALPPDAQMSATEILTLVSALLREAQIEPFELALWQQWNKG
ncbi:hypothetical protein [Amorphus sp. 3PC139-8]|uniref:hypothetical protein n=1 Tax=Amorphus sp. 3PC139-8 TaxID=2735676 RepID=UPI00345D6739